jgi:hypothetical protein
MPGRPGSPKLWAMTMKRVVIGLIVVAAVLILALLHALASALPNGQVPGDFDFYGETISAARADRFAELEEQLEEVAGRFGVAYVGPSGWADHCDEGFDDFTRRDTYAYRCWIEIVRIVPVQKPFEANASRLGEALLEGDCPHGTETDRILRDIADVQELEESSGECSSRLYLDAPVISGWLPADPSAHQLERATSDLPLKCYESARGHCDERLLDLGGAVAAPPEGTVAFAIVTAGGNLDEYHTVDWDRPWFS